MKSAGVYRLRADMQKLGFCDRKFAAEAWMLVKLHRPPPEMRIFSPAALAWSMTSTRRPRLPASMAHIMPAAPAPITMTSNAFTGFL